MMLDLSTGRGATTKMVMDDWKFLCDQVKVREDSRYLHHQGKPVVLLWGLGFRDRPWSPEQGAELVAFFKNDPKYGGVYLIGGVDPFWRTLRGESRPDPAWAKVYRSFDAISPWDAGRYRDDASMDRIRKQVWEGDLAELKDLGQRLHADGVSRILVGQPATDAAGPDDDPAPRWGVLLAAVRDLQGAGNPHRLRRHVRRSRRRDGDLQGGRERPRSESTS